MLTIRQHVRPSLRPKLASARAKRAAPRFGFAALGRRGSGPGCGIFWGYILAGGAATPQDGLVVSAQVLTALDTQLASADHDRESDQQVRVRLTFRDAGDNLCRSFETPSTAGVACRDKGTWTVRALVSQQPHKQADYRMATSGNAAIMAYIDAQISGDPLDAAAEKRAMQSEWTTQ